MHFNEDQTACLDTLARKINQRKGVQLTAAVVDRSGSYPEIPWKAFAAGVCAHALMHLLQAFLYQERLITWGVQHTLGFIIGTSALIALLTQYWPVFGSIFLSPAHAEKSVRLYAESMFARQGIFNTPERKGILMLVSLFESRVIVVPDSGTAATLDTDAQRHIIDAMAPLLRRHDYFEAMKEGLQAIDDVLPVTLPEPLVLQDHDSVSEVFIQVKGLDP
jgi:putative membrane protein